MGTTVAFTIGGLLGATASFFSSCRRRLARRTALASSSGSKVLSVAGWGFAQRVSFHFHRRSFPFGLRPFTPGRRRGGVFVGERATTFVQRPGARVEMPAIGSLPSLAFPARATAAIRHGAEAGRDELIDGEVKEIRDARDVVRGDGAFTRQYL